MDVDQEVVEFDEVTLNQRSGETPTVFTLKAPTDLHAGNSDVLAIAGSSLAVDVTWTVTNVSIRNLSQNKIKAPPPKG